MAVGALAAVGAILGGACGGAETASVDPAGSSGPTTSAVAEAGEQPAAPSDLLSFRGEAIGGGDVDASIYQGRPVLLWFWSPW